MQAQASLSKQKFNTTNLAMFSLYFFMINIFAKYFVPDIVTKILPVLAVCLAIIICKTNALRFQRSIIGYLLFALLYFFCSIYSPAPGKGLLYSLSFIISVVYVSCGIRFNIDWKKAINIISIVCIIFTTGLLLQSFFPDIFKRITAIFNYSSVERYYIDAWAKNKWYTGFFPDRAPAAFFSSILCGTGLYYLLKNRKSEVLKARLVGLILFVYGIVGILLTAKRGLLFGMMLATFICYLVNRRAMRKPILLIVLVTIFVSIVGYLIVSHLSIAEVMISRIFSNEDFYTNRLDIYQNIYENIKSNFFIGTGTASANSLLGVGGHNIYLTVLMENGIVGFIIFILVWFTQIFRCIENIFEMGKNQYNEFLAVLTLSLFVQTFFLVYGMSGNPLYDNYILNFYFLGVLMNENVRYQIQKAKSSDNNIPVSV